MAKFEVTFYNENGFGGATETVNAGAHMSTSQIKKIAEARNPGARAHRVERINERVEGPGYSPSEYPEPNAGWRPAATGAAVGAAVGSAASRVTSNDGEGSGCGFVVLGGSLGFLFLIYIVTQFLPFLLAAGAGTAATKLTEGQTTKRILLTIAAAGSAAFLTGDLSQRALQWGPYYVPSAPSESVSSASERALPSGITMENCERYYSATECAGIF